MVSVDEFDILKEADEEELFYLQNGLTVSSVRDLVHQIKLMNQKIFDHHVTDEKNDFATWIKNVFKDKKLANNLEESSTKEEVIRVLEDRIVELEKEKLKEFGLNINKTTLIRIEDFIVKRYEAGKNDEDIKQELLDEDFNINLIEFMLNINDKQVLDLDNILNKAHNLKKNKTLEIMKKYVIINVADGVPVEELKNFLIHKGWNEEIIDFILFDVFKPHPKLYKLKHYIKYQLENKDKNIQEIRKDLQDLSWDDYVIDFVINGIKNPESTPLKAIKYMEDSSMQSKENLTKYLHDLGWRTINIQSAFVKKENQNSLQTILNILKKQELSLAKGINPTKDKNMYELKSDTIGTKIRKTLLQHCQEIKIQNKVEEDTYLKIGKNHFNISNLPGLIKEKSYFSLNKILTLRDTVYKANTNDFLIVYHKSTYYLFLPIIKTQACMACGKKYPLQLLSKVEFWNEERTKKITKYVCKEHENVIKGLMLDKKLVQS